MYYRLVILQTFSFIYCSFISFVYDVLYDVKLDEVPLLKWERTAVGEFDINFTFGDYDLEPIG